MALSMLGWAIYRGEWALPPLAETSDGTDPLTYRRLALIISLPLALGAFTLFDNNLFTKTNLCIWLVAVVLFVAAFWINRNKRLSIFGGIFQNGFTINISPWALLLIAATACQGVGRTRRLCAGDHEQGNQEVPQAGRPPG